MLSIRVAHLGCRLQDEASCLTLVVLSAPEKIHVAIPHERQIVGLRRASKGRSDHRLRRRWRFGSGIAREENLECAGRWSRPERGEIFLFGADHLRECRCDGRISFVVKANVCFAYSVVYATDPVLDPGIFNYQENFGGPEIWNGLGYNDADEQ
ncbi:hypothetical protein [Silicimonas algicola]|uniref:hypothetical protein n=1 Tax=Silicimonas algicola TaxID=1826607 RepID=UPI001475C564|nr:hypothetical protein [Silicimonas algicola]